MASRPVRSAAKKANMNFRDSSESPELSPPPPSKRARAANSKQQPSGPNPRSSRRNGTQRKQPTQRAAFDPVPAEPQAEVIEISDSDGEEAPVVEPEPQTIPELIEVQPENFEEMVFVKTRLDGTMARDDEQGVWWPAGVVDRDANGSLNIFLLSVICPGVSRHLTAPVPAGEGNVRPMRSSSGVLSTNVSNYRVTIEPGKLSKSTSNRLDAAFKRGLEHMDSVDDDADFPTISKLLASNTRTFSNKRSPPVTQADTWTPPGPERNLEIPGELVLATQEKPEKIRPTTPFWAGRIDAFLPPRDKNTPAKYTVTFFEDTIDDLERCQFYTSAEPQFVTCPLGPFKSNDTVNDEDEDNVPEDPDVGQFEPSIPPPPPDEFDELPLLHQFAYTVPVLHAIISDEYEPTKALHERFERGGASRIKLKHKSPSIGQMKETTIKKFWGLVDNWALGLETRVVMPSPLSLSGRSVPLPPSREGSADTECMPDFPPSSLPTSSSRRTFSTASSTHDDLDSTMSLPSRPQGCEYYESLSDEERREYCSLILHGEAVLQLLLWRAGKRDFLGPASAEVEDDLRKEAIKLSKQGDILTLVMELRELMKQGSLSLTSKREPTLVGPRSVGRTGSGTRSSTRQGSFRGS
ncbi:unnamed protein product [Peniophora sp. CBMAI 1063]|nr:unnamed protein product [Peniophora sp. CBMAI 1063]